MVVILPQTPRIEARRQSGARHQADKTRTAQVRLDRWVANPLVAKTANSLDAHRADFHLDVIDDRL
jgi:hypothetical protein